MPLLSAGMQVIDERLAATSPLTSPPPTDEPVKSRRVLRRTASERHCGASPKLENSNQLQRHHKQQQQHQQHSLSQPRSSSALMSSYERTMTPPEEHDSLPSLQKRHFASLERLRPSQGRVSDKRKKQQQHQQPPSRESWFEAPRPSFSAERPSSSQSLFRSPSRHARQASESISIHQPFTTEEEAVWFLTLPGKARRQQFSVEEQQVLTTHCQRLVSTTSRASNETSTFPQRAPVHIRDQSVATTCVSPTPDAMLNADLASEFGANEPSTGMERFKKFCTKRRKSNAPPPLTVTPLTPPPEYVLSVSPPPPRHGEASVPKGFPRSRHLKPISLPPPKLAPLLESSSQSVVRNFSTPFRTEQRVASPSPSHQQWQSDAGSQSGTFDRADSVSSTRQANETIQFGFQPPAKDYLSDPATSCSSPGMPSFFDSQDEDEGSQATREPLTPPPMVDEADIYKAVSVHHGSVDSGVVILPDRYHVEKMVRGTQSLSDMSYTVKPASQTVSHRRISPYSRDDLYLDEKHAIAESTETDSDADPLSLEPLPMCDDLSGEHGAFAAHPHLQKNGLRRVLKHLRTSH